MSEKLTKPKTNENPADTGEALLFASQTTEPTYQVTLTASQVRVLSQSADLLARVLRGQWHTVPEPLLTFLPNSEDTGQMARLLTAHAETLRGMGRSVERDVHDILAKEPYRRDPKLPFEKSCIAWDLHEALRHQLWQDEPNRYSMSTHGCKPLKCSGTQALPIIAKMEVK